MRRYGYWCFYCFIYDDFFYLYVCVPQFIGQHIPAHIAAKKYNSGNTIFYNYIGQLLGIGC